MNEHRGKCFFVLTLSSKTTVQRNTSDCVAPTNVLDLFQISAFFLQGRVGNKSHIPFDQISWQPAPEIHPSLLLLLRGEVLTFLVFPHGNLL